MSEWPRASRQSGSSPVHVFTGRVRPLRRRVWRVWPLIRARWARRVEHGSYLEALGTKYCATVNLEQETKGPSFNLDACCPINDQTWAVPRKRRLSMSHFVVVWWCAWSAVPPRLGGQTLAGPPLLPKLHSQPPPSP
jgi:hypothetical protein